MGTSIDVGVFEGQTSKSINLDVQVRFPGNKTGRGVIPS